MPCDINGFRNGRPLSAGIRVGPAVSTLSCKDADLAAFGSVPVRTRPVRDGRNSVETRPPPYRIATKRSEVAPVPVRIHGPRPSFPVETSLRSIGARSAAPGEGRPVRRARGTAARAGPGRRMGVAFQGGFAFTGVDPSCWSTRLGPASRSTSRCWCHPSPARRSRRLAPGRSGGVAGGVPESAPSRAPQRVRGGRCRRTHAQRWHGVHAHAGAAVFRRPSGCSPASGSRRW